MNQPTSTGRAYFLAVCDILGFADFVRTVPLEDVVAHGVGGLRHALYFSMYSKDPPDGVQWQEFAGHDHVGAAWFSDTILLYTKQDADEAIRSLLSILSSLIFFMMGRHTRLRAGVAYGEAFIDVSNAMFVGQPIVDAARLEKQQQWSGGALHESACQRVRRVAGNNPPMDWWLLPYAVPLKQGATLQTLAVNWNEGIHAPAWRLLWRPESKDPTADDWAMHPDVCEKFVHTRRFHEAFCRDCNPALRSRSAIAL